jgi:hypothetical protein
MINHTYDDERDLIHENGTEFSSEDRYSWFEAHKAQYMSVLRAERNKRLEACDWVVVKYIEMGKNIPTVWIDYRQQLRDITNLYDKQATVIWPTKPE